jgi:hypothetical protein
MSEEDWRGSPAHCRRPPREWERHLHGGQTVSFLMTSAIENSLLPLVSVM